MTEVTAQQRHALWKRVPWITYLDASQQCDGVRFSSMPLKAMTDQAIMKRYQCKNRARWHFVALRGRKGDDLKGYTGTYCLQHLWNNMSYPAREYERYLKWWSDSAEELLYEEAQR